MQSSQQVTWTSQRAPYPTPLWPKRSYARSSATYDALAISLLQKSSADRRHLVVVYTDGVDDASVVTPTRLINVARIADAAVYWVRRESVESRAGLLSFALWPPLPSLIGNIVDLTGGGTLYALGQSLVEPVGKILDEFRTRYIIHFQPTGVLPTGWHLITVTLRRPAGYEVTARRGYFGG